MNQSEIDFFDRLAPTWDSNEVRSTPERVRSILSRLPIRPGDSVLDLGTGTGVLIPYLSEMVGPEGHVLGLDLSTGMLGLAKEKYGDLPNVDFRLIDFEEEVIPGTYDLVMMYCVYPHLHAPKQTMDWLFKMNVKPGGAIVVAFPSDEGFINAIHHERKSESDHLPSAEALAARMADWGFAARVVASTPDEYIVEVKAQSAASA